MNFYEFLFKVALAMLILGLFAMLRLKAGSAEFYVNLMGLGVNALVLMLSLLKIKPHRR